MKPRQAAVAFIFVTVTLDMLTVGLIGPVLPKLILNFLGGNMKNAADWNGWFGLVFALMQFFFSPVLGVLSDKFGRRPVILLSNLGLGLDYIVMAVAPSMSWLFLGRIISGITTSSIPTAMAYIADVVPKEERAGAFGMIGVAFGARISAAKTIASALLRPCGALANITREAAAIPCSSPRQVTMFRYVSSICCLLHRRSIARASGRSS